MFHNFTLNMPTGVLAHL